MGCERTSVGVAERTDASRASEAAPRRVPGAVVAADLGDAIVAVVELSVADERPVELGGAPAWERTLSLTPLSALRAAAPPRALTVATVTRVAPADRVPHQRPVTSLDGWELVDAALSGSIRAIALVGGPPIGAPRGLGGRTPRVVGGPLDGQPVRLVISEPALEEVLPALIALGANPEAAEVERLAARHPLADLDALRRATRRPPTQGTVAALASLVRRCLAPARPAVVRLSALELIERALGMTEAGSVVAGAILDPLMEAWLGSAAGDSPAEQAVELAFLETWNASAEQVGQWSARDRFLTVLDQRTLAEDGAIMRRQIHATLGL